MQVTATLKNIITIHTGTETSKADQPMIEVTLEMNDGTNTQEIKFTEMLSNLAGMDEAAVMDYFQDILADYVGTAYKGQQALEPVSGDWKHAKTLEGRQFIIEV